MAAEQQRIHPVDVEAAKASAPLVPPSAPRSDHRSDHRRTIPLSHARAPKRKHGCCCRCVCWSLLALLLALLAVAATAGILYLVFRPKLPSYSVDRLNVTAFSIDPTTLTARASFDLTVTAYNPNKRIGIYYEDGSQLTLSYGDTTLCSGTFPVFYQGHRNRTTVMAPLAGDTQLGTQITSALRQQQQTGTVPLTFRAHVPVKVKLGGLKLWKVNARVRCDLVVSSLTPGNLISIKTSNCNFRLKL